MKIEWIKGKKSEDDRIITITTKEKEWFSIYKLVTLVNQIAMNELRLSKGKEYDKFLFEEAIIDVIDMAKQGKDFSELSKEELINWCEEHYLPEKSLKEIEWQKKLGDFENESKNK